MTYKIGFDIGSTTIKAVVLDENQQICYKIMPTEIIGNIFGDRK